MLTLGIRPDKNPPLHELHYSTFQKLCCALFEKEAGISECSEYGTSGQAQFGIDIRAYRKDGDGIEVGQCKCYEAFDSAKIKRASEEFFKHWTRWKKQGVKKFILFVACDLSNTDTQDEIEKQKKRFKRRKVVYEAWSVATIVNKLRPHKGIVSHYLTPSAYWVGVICGEDLPRFTQVDNEDKKNSFTRSSYLEAVLITHTSTTHEKDLAQMRSAWREGREDETLQWLRNTKSDHDLWSVLSSSVKAKILRFEAGIQLELGQNLSRIKELANEADALTPAEKGIRLGAFIALGENNPEQALQILADHIERDSQNLKAGILLQLGRASEGLEFLKDEACDATLNPENKPNAETHRLRALAHLHSGDLSRARLESQKALEMEPRWVNMRLTEAVVGYYSALAPMTIPKQPETWPAPVEWMFVKRDAESLQSLSTAAKVFQRLAISAPRSVEARRVYETWCLACLANNPENQSQAIEYCQTLLQNDPTHCAVFIWAIARAYAIDFASCVQKIEALVSEGSATIPHVLALTSFYLTNKRAPEVLTLLEQTQPLFSHAHAETLWAFWRARALIATDQTEAALKITETPNANVELCEAHAAALYVVAKSTGDWQPVVLYLEASYEATQEPDFLLKACEVMAQQQKWNYVADHAEWIVQTLATAEGLHFASIAVYRANRFELCLKLLDTHQAWFKNDQLPNELRELRIACHLALGVLPKAIADAEAQARKDPSTQNLYRLIQLYLEKGDFKNIALVAPQLYERSDLSPEQTLQIINLIRWDNFPLAQDFWRKVASSKLPDALVGPVYVMGGRLGFTKELKPLSKRMAELGQKGLGGIQVFSIEDFKELAKQHNDHLSTLEEVYRTGTIPTHALAALLNVPLVDFYHTRLSANEHFPEPFRQPYLMARHGGRELIKEFNSNPPPWRLHLDISAVLLANHLDILPLVEQIYAPLHITAELIPALIYMREQIAHPQPKRFQTFHQIVDLAQRGRLAVVDSQLPPNYQNMLLVEEVGAEWVARFESARAAHGYLAVFLPVRKQDLSGLVTALPSDAESCLVNCRALLEILHKHGPLSAKEYNAALDALGAEGLEPPSEVQIQTGWPLYCDAGILEILAEANLLAIVCQKFQAKIERRDLERMQGALRYENFGQETDTWLANLIRRLGDGVDKNTYAIIPTVSNSANASEEALDEHPYMRCIRALLRFEPHEGDVIWSDDRFFNSYRNGVLTIGINEILKVLTTTAKLTTEEYYEKLRRLRAANVRFIPLEAGEIVYHLQQAPINDHSVVETQDLSLLRRYVASCLLQNNALQKPTSEAHAPNPKGEIAFVLNLGHVVGEALKQIWESEGDLNVCYTKSNWVMSNLFLDHLGMLDLTGLRRPEHDDRYITGMSLAELISLSLLLPFSKGKPKTQRKAYLEWIYERVIHSHIKSDPLIVATIASFIKKFTFGKTVELAPEAHEEVLLKVKQFFFRDLPLLFQEELSNDADFAFELGIKPTITIDGLHFERNAFWLAAAEATNGREATIAPIGLDKLVVFNPLPEGDKEVGFDFEHPTTGEKCRMGNGDCHLLLESLAARETFIRRNRAWFDYPPDDGFEHILAEIVSTSELAKRIEKFAEWKKTSLVFYYKDLAESLREKDEFNFDQLIPPQAESLVRHFRLNLDLDMAFPEALAAGAKTLIDHEGLPVALARCMWFPVALPLLVLETATVLPSTELRVIIKRLLKQAGSPISRLHLLRLLSEFGDKIPAFQRLARRIIKQIISEQGAKEFATFKAMLQWVMAEFQRWVHLSPHIRLALAWAHAHQLFAIFTAAKVSIDWLLENFSHQEQGNPFDVLGRDADAWLDVTYPNRIHYMQFALAGLSYAIGNNELLIKDDDLSDLYISLEPILKIVR